MYGFEIKFDINEVSKNFKRKLESSCPKGTASIISKNQSKIQSAFTYVLYML